MRLSPKDWIIGGVLAAGIWTVPCVAFADPSAAAPPANVSASVSTSQPITLGERFTLQSEVLGEAREIFVRLPEDYESSDNDYMVLYVLDAEWFFIHATAAVEMLSECTYIRIHPIPQLIIVGVVNIDRNRDYTPTHNAQQHGMSFPTSGSADKFTAFLETELIPFIDQRYHTRDYRVLAGWSFGGLFTMNTLLERPELFDAYLAISPSLWWDDELLLTRTAALAGQRHDKSLVMTIGTKEEGGLCYNAVKKLLGNWEAKPIAGLEVRHVEVPGVSHNYTPPGAFFEGLAEMFSDRFAPDEVAQQGLGAVDAYYARLSQKYRENLRIPGYTYNAVVNHCLRESKFDEAIAVANTRTKRHPDSPDAWFELVQLYRKLEERELARDACEKAIEVELRKDDPDEVFVNYVTGVMKEL